MKNIFFKTLPVVAFSLAIVSCEPNAPVEKTTFLETKTITLEDTLSNGLKIEGDAHSGKYFSRTDSASIYGCGTIFNIPDSLLQYDIKIKFNGWVRIGDLSKDKKFAFSLEGSDGKSIVWEQIDFKKRITETNKWINVIDSVLIPGNMITKSNLIIKTFSYNPDGHSTLDCDDIELTFNKIEKKLE